MNNKLIFSVNKENINFLCTECSLFLRRKTMTFIEIVDEPVSLEIKGHGKSELIENFEKKS